MNQSPRDVMEAWNSVTDEWIVRRNKDYRVKQWEVVHDWGGDLISDETMKVVARFASEEAAEDRARFLEDYARGAAVLSALAGCFREAAVEFEKLQAWGRQAELEAKYRGKAFRPL